MAQFNRDISESRQNESVDESNEGNHNSTVKHFQSYYFTVLIELYYYIMFYFLVKQSNMWQDN